MEIELYIRFKNINETFAEVRDVRDYFQFISDDKSDGQKLIISRIIQTAVSALLLLMGHKIY